MRQVKRDMTDTEIIEALLSVRLSSWFLALAVIQTAFLMAVLWLSVFNVEHGLNLKALGGVFFLTFMFFLFSFILRINDK